MENTAHWIYILNTTSDGNFYGGVYRCSNCKSNCLGKCYEYPTHERYCHNCGSHMIEKPIMEINEYYGEKYTWE